MDAQMLTQIPHLEEIAHRGAFSGTPEKHTENFLERSSRENKILPSLEDAVRAAGLKDGMTISFHHHFRGGDHVVNQVVEKLAAMGLSIDTLTEEQKAFFGGALMS